MTKRLSKISLAMLSGSRIKGSKSIGKTCVPVRISQPAFTPDQVQMTAAMIIVMRVVRIVGRR
ncbi:MAG: hypothetical protein ACM3VT_11285 [Solirubrobacterales bacterium]